MRVWRRRETFTLGSCETLRSVVRVSPHLTFHLQIVVQEMGGDNDTQGREILDILYATEEGFAVPEEEDGEF